VYASALAVLGLSAPTGEANVYHAQADNHGGRYPHLGRDQRCLVTLNAAERRDRRGPGTVYRAIDAPVTVRAGRSSVGEIKLRSKSFAVVRARRASGAP